MPDENGQITVLLAEDQALLRFGLKMLLQQKKELSVVGEANDGSEAIKLAALLKPDVILMDVGMPNVDGIEAAQEIRKHDRATKIIMLTASDSDEHVFAALSAGANGYCLKETDPERLVGAIKTVHAGDLWFDSSIAQKVVRGLPQSKTQPKAGAPTDTETTGSHGRLTKQEFEVLNLIVEGFSAEDISAKVGIDLKAVRALEFTIVEKLAASERTQSALKLLKEGYDPDVVSNKFKVCPKCNRQFREGFFTCPVDSSELVALTKDRMVGETFADRYEIVSLLGAGGMSVVYQAKHKLMKRTVAIKIIDPLLLSDLGNAKRFRHEAEIASMLNHPNLITVFDFGLSEDGEAFIVMDYISGRNLDELIATGGPIAVDRALKIFIQACDALQYAHSKGILHRDLKPSNFMLVAEGKDEVLKIIDFGIAKLMAEHTAAAVGLTAHGEVLGSLAYMSPEQCKGEPLDERSDIYSLGCLMYEAVSGQQPIEGVATIDTMFKQIEENPIPLTQSAPKAHIPASLDRVIMKTLMKKREDRQQSMAELKQDLQAVLAEVAPV
jgi:DNA-binding NarL/FixJ family response regulator/tRNA A-37 threonylcarbamoyl transferase component Bud32